MPACFGVIGADFACAAGVAVEVRLRDAVSADVDRRLSEAGGVGA